MFFSPQLEIKQKTSIIPRHKSRLSCCSAMTKSLIPHFIIIRRPVNGPAIQIPIVQELPQSFPYIFEEIRPFILPDRDSSGAPPPGTITIPSTPTTTTSPFITYWNYSTPDDFLTLDGSTTTDVTFTTSESTAGISIS